MAGWRVWAELRRRTHIDLAWAHLVGRDGQLEELGAGRRRITLDSRLDAMSRRAVLAHELVHDERGILYTDDTPLGLIRKEEALVDAETCRRLVPLDELDTLVRHVVADGGQVTWREVSDWFDVPRDVAERALEQLLRRALASHPAQRRRQR